MQTKMYSSVRGGKLSDGLRPAFGHRRNHKGKAATKRLRQQKKARNQLVKRLKGD